MRAILGRLVVTTGLMAGLTGCEADGGYGSGYAPAYGPSYGGIVGYEAPLYRGYEPRRGYFEPDYYHHRPYPQGGYRSEPRWEERHPPVREERRAAPPREERRPSPGIAAPFARPSAGTPRYSGPPDPRQGPNVNDHEGGR
jgi:hypothetical protein